MKQLLIYGMSATIVLKKAVMTPSYLASPFQYHLPKLGYSTVNQKMPHVVPLYAMCQQEWRNCTIVVSDSVALCSELTFRLVGRVRMTNLSS